MQDLFSLQGKVALITGAAQGIGRDADQEKKRVAGKAFIPVPNRMLDEYYDLHGWDRKTSFPTGNALESLGLKSEADDAEKIGKIG